MIKIFLTGDNHFGKKYKDHLKAAQLIETRFECLNKMVCHANEEQCSLFVIAGDLFENTYSIAKKDIRRIIEMLGRFHGEVLILPGNHDYYNEDSKVWKDFESEKEVFENITLLNKFEELILDINGEKVVIYPAMCQSKHSSENNLGWIKEADIEKDLTYRIGIAHGAIEGLTIDNEGKYFMMTRDELNHIPVDVWLIGHTHVPYPDNLQTERYIEGNKIYNAGTHAQTDVACNTEGNCFIIELDNSKGSEKIVKAKKYVSGHIRFYRNVINIVSDPDNDHNLEETLKRELNKYNDDSVIDIIIKGAVTRHEYNNRAKIYDSVLERFLEAGISTDSELSEIITEDMIKMDFVETSFSARLLMELLEEPKEAQMVYELLKSGELK